MFDRGGDNASKDEDKGRETLMKMKKTRQLTPVSQQEVTSTPPQVDEARASEEEKERESSRQAAMLQGFMQFMQERDGQRDQMISQMQNQVCQ